MWIVIRSVYTYKRNNKIILFIAFMKNVGKCDIINGKGIVIFKKKNIFSFS